MEEKLTERQIYKICQITGSISEEQWRKLTTDELKLEDETFQEFKIRGRYFTIAAWMRENSTLDISPLLDFQYRLKYGDNEATEASVSEQKTVWTSLTASADGKKKVVGLARTICEENKRQKCASDDRTRAYPLSNKGGCALIISNSFSEFPITERKNASRKDLEVMENLWCKTVGCELFEGKVHTDQSAAEMKALLTKISVIKEKYDFIVVVISTHGGLMPEHWVDKQEDKSFDSKMEGKGEVCEERGNSEDNRKSFEEFHQCITNMRHGKRREESSMIEVFFGNDHKPIRERELRKYFYNDNATGLHDVPKFLILDYCRGNFSSSGVLREGIKDKGVGFVESATFPTDVLESQTGIEDECAGTSLLPAISDVLVAYATHPSYVAYQCREQGSWLISTIGDVFTKNHKSMHALEMLTLVNREIKSKVGKKFVGCGHAVKQKAMSVFESSLEKDLYLT